MTQLKDSMSDIEKIRQEVERRKGYISVTHFAEELLSFIDSLPKEKPSEDLEKAAKNIYKVPFGTRAEDFIVGAEWQKKQDENWLNDQLTRVHLDGVITGAEIAEKSMFKPTQEQLDALDTVYKTHGANSACRHILLNLLNQLKELQ